MADDKPKVDARTRWFVECSDSVRRIVRLLAADAGTSTEKMAGELLAGAAATAYAALSAKIEAESKGLTPPAKPPRRPRKPGEP